MKVEFEFKKKINNKGFYAKIKLEADLIEDRGIQLVCDENSQWYSSIRFACDYLYESSFRKGDGGLKVIVHELNSQLIDTSSIVVVYATIMAIKKALVIFDEGDIVIDDNGNLLLPK